MHFVCACVCSAGTELTLRFARPGTRLLMYPYFAALLDTFNAVLNGSSPTRLHVTAAHDTVLKVLLVAMGAVDDDWPPYAARLVFELHRRRGVVGTAGSSSGFVRVVYDGRDVTHRLPCHRAPSSDNGRGGRVIHADAGGGHGLCSLHSFEQMVAAMVHPYASFAAACHS